MANKFRPIVNTPIPEEDYSEMNKPKNRPIPSKKKKPKSKSKIGKKIRKAFDNIFGLGILRKINFRKNLPYFIMIIIMIIALIYNNLNTQSKRLKIEKLEDEITKVNDLLMDVIEEEYSVDDKQEKELLQTAKEEGFQSNGYIPYTIKVEKKEK